MRKNHLLQRGKRLSALLLTLVFMIALLPTAALAADYTGHWAASSIEKAVKMGWFSDGNNTRPTASITRAEFVTMVNRMKGYTGEADLSVFSDVKPSDWYYGAFSTAVANGYITGSNGKLNPGANITRNEAITIFARVSELDTYADNSAYLNGVRDAGSIPVWAKPYAGAAIKAGLIAGTNGNFNGGSNITRAETAVLLERLYDNIRTYGFAGTYTGDANGVIIAGAGVTLKDANISGDLTISKAVGDGEVTLDNVNVEGKLDVQGGGMNSVYIKNSKISSIVVTKDEVRVVFQDGTTATYANVAGENSAIVIGNGAKVDNIVVEADAQGANIVLESGAKVDNVTVSAPDANVSLESGVKVNTLTVAESASGTAVSVANGATVTTASVAGSGSTLELASGATVTTLTVASTATGTTVATESGAKIGTATIAAKGTEVTGSGTITTANIKAADVVIEQKPTTTNVDSGVKADVGGSTVTGTGSTGGGGGGGNDNSGSSNPGTTNPGGTNPGGSNVTVSSVSVDPTTATITVGATRQLAATVSPTNATTKTVAWSSSNDVVATVNNSGLVTGVAAGTATITATTTDGSKTATCAVTVNSAVGTFTISHSTPTLTAPKTGSAVLDLTTLVAETSAIGFSITAETADASKIAGTISYVGTTVAVTSAFTGADVSIAFEVKATNYTTATITVTIKALPALSGTASITGLNKIGQTLTAVTTSITGGSGAFNYEWKAGSATLASSASNTYVIQGADVGKTITCDITRADAKGTVTAAGATAYKVPYTLKLDNSGLAVGDSVSFANGSASLETTAETGIVNIYYTLTDTSTSDELYLSFKNTSITKIDTPAPNGTHPYTFDANDASDGVITITASSVHTSLLILPPPAAATFTSNGSIGYTASGTTPATMSYTATLYKDGSAVTGFTDIPLTTNPLNPSGIDTELSKAAGAYTVKVTAHTTDTDYTSTSIAAVSNAVNVYSITVTISGVTGAENVSSQTSSYVARCIDGNTAVFTAVPGTGRKAIWTFSAGTLSNNALSIAAKADASVTVTFADTVAQTITVGTYDKLTPIVGEEITATAGTYIANDGGNAGTHTYQWKVSDSATGAGTSATGTGATSNKYTAAAADYGKYIWIEITPVGTASPSITGTPVASPRLRVGVKLTAAITTTIGSIDTIYVDGVHGATGKIVYGITDISVSLVGLPNAKVTWTANPATGTFGDSAVASTTYTPAGTAGTVALTATVVNTYTVTYNGNQNTGGTVPASKSGIVAGSAHTTEAPTALVRTGYTFEGWSTSATGSNPTVTGQLITINADTTLYAVWQPVAPSATSVAPTTATVNFTKINGLSASTTYEYQLTISAAETAWSGQTEVSGKTAIDDLDVGNNTHIQIRVKSGATWIAGAAQILALNKVPAAPTGSIDYTDEKVTSVDNTLEYVIDANTTYSTGSFTGVTGTEITLASNIPANGSASKYIHIRKAASGGTPAGAVQTLTIKARPATPSYTIDYVAEKTTQTVPATVKHSTNNDMTSPSFGTNAVITVTPGTNLYFQTTATGIDFASAIQTLTVAARPATPSLTNSAIDFVNETVTIADTIEYVIAASNATPTTYGSKGSDSAISITGSIVNSIVTPTNSIFYRTAAVAGTSFASAAGTALEIPARPAVAPAVVTSGAAANNICLEDGTNGTVTVTIGNDLSSGSYQYSIDGGTSWTTLGTPISTGAGSFTIQIRVAPTGSAFGGDASAGVTVSVSGS